MKINNLKDLTDYLDKLNPKTKVRIVFKDYELWRNFLPLWNDYEKKFILFKDKKEFITQLPSVQIRSKKIGLVESLKKFLEDNKVEEKIKEVLLKEIHA
jgi:hypothetical protein